MVYLAIHEILLPLWLVLIFGSKNCLFGRALPCKVTSLPTLETGSVITAVHSVRLERLAVGLAVHSGETVAAHWVNEPVAEASALGCSGAMPDSLVIACVMEDADHASTGEPYLGF
jgi:hypothetical protein